MSEQLLVRLTKQNRCREMYSPIRQNTRNNETQALSTVPCVSPYRRVHFPRICSILKEGWNIPWLRGCRHYAGETGVKPG